jgi:hypothetical protein
MSLRDTVNHEKLPLPCRTAVKRKLFGAEARPKDRLLVNFFGAQVFRILVAVEVDNSHAGSLWRIKLQEGLVQYMRQVDVTSFVILPLYI